MEFQKQEITFTASPEAMFVLFMAMRAATLTIGAKLVPYVHKNPNISEEIDQGSRNLSDELAIRVFNTKTPTNAQIEEFGKKVLDL
jgi:hypothetical protein